jgi:hypothetical protein
MPIRVGFRERGVAAESATCQASSFQSARLTSASLLLRLRWTRSFFFRDPTRLESMHLRRYDHRWNLERARTDNADGFVRRVRGGGHMRIYRGIHRGGCMCRRSADRPGCRPASRHVRRIDVPVRPDSRRKLVRFLWGVPGAGRNRTDG